MEKGSCRDDSIKSFLFFVKERRDGMRKCLYCGTYFEEQKYQRFCSEKCKHEQRLLKQRAKRKEKIQCRGYKPRRSHLEWTDDDVQNRINTKSDKMIYIGGYVDSESWIYLYCSDCGQSFRWNAGGLRKQRPIICNNCRHIISDVNNKTHRTDIEERKRIKRELREQQQTSIKTRLCKECGNEFIVKRNSGSGYYYCSVECRKKAQNREHYIKRRIKLKTITRDDGISIKRIMKRDGNLCWICNKPVDVTDYEVRDDGVFLAGPNYPSIDHVQALANGGSHTWGNTRLAHRRCNWEKSDKLVYVGIDSQIKMYL